MKVRALLVDMGGVILRGGDHGGLPPEKLDWRGRQALLSLLHRHGARLEMADLERRLFGPYLRRHAERHEAGRDPDWAPHLRRLRRGTGVRVRNLPLLAAWFRPYAEELEPLPGARQALAELRARGLGLALVSNVPLPGRLYVQVLERHGLRELFDSLHFSYDSGHRKPSPAMLREALAALGVPARQAAMVGDRRSADVAAGRAAGVRTIWVRSDDRGGPDPDHEVGSLAEVPGLLERLEGSAG